jgi:hypothetical protein
MDSSVRSREAECSGYTRTTLTMKIGSAKVPVKPVKGGGSARGESRLCKDFRVTGPVQSARLQEPLDPELPGDNGSENHPTADIIGGQDTRAWNGGRRVGVFRPRVSRPAKKSWLGKVVQISGKAKARADAPLQ